jgi:hypothetical protein
MGRMTLIETINASIAAVDWNAANPDWQRLFSGMKLGKYSASDIEAAMTYWNGLNTQVGYNEASCMRKIADMNGITSSGIDVATKYTLDHFPFFSGKHCPVNDSREFHGHMSYRFGTSNLYRVSKAMNYNTTKWNSTLAWQEMKAAIEAVGYSSGTRLSYNLDDNSTWDDNNRFYDENDEWIEWFISMFEIDRDANKGALTYAVGTIWEYINNIHWAGDHFYYSPTWHNFECEGAFFHLIFCRMMALNGYGLPNWDRVILDMKTRFINSGWSSPQWVEGGTPIYCVIHHNPDNPEHRLQNTIGAWFTLQAFWQILDTTSQATLISMLNGTTTAWENFCNYSGLYNAGTHQFRWANGQKYVYADSSTASAVIMLFLLGIVPVTGALYSPIHEWLYESWANMDDYFRFNATTRVLRLPIAKGNIKFIYGSTPFTQSFAEDGLYDLQFASDWNSLSSSPTKVSTLDALKTYVRPIGVSLVRKHTTLTLSLVKS